MTASTYQQSTRVVCIALAAFGLVALGPMWPPLLLAVWFSGLARRPAQWLSRSLGEKHRAAALVSTLLVLVIVLPIVLVGTSLVTGAIQFARLLSTSTTARSAIEAIVSPDGSQGNAADIFSVHSLVQWVREYGAQAGTALAAVLGATIRGAIGLFVFVFGSYTFLVDGPVAYRWFSDRLGIAPAHLDRLAAAFHETGRGLLVGVGLTGLAQGALATMTYIVLGVPRALVLGFLTCLGALIPSVGTALVWLPVAAALALTGRWGAALAMTFVGAFVIGTIDNVLRPLLTRYGKLQCPTFVLVVSIFGGLVIFGGWGLVLGPLAARMAIEALEILRDMRSTSDSSQAALPASHAGVDDEGERCPSRDAGTL